MSSSVTHSSRRRVPRRNFNSSVGCLFHGQYMVVRSVQVGEGGMSIRTSFEAKVGDKMILTFRVPRGSIVCVRGDVRYRDQDQGSGLFTVGVQFENLSFNSKRELRNLVASAVNETIKV